MLVWRIRSQLNHRAEADHYIVEPVYDGESRFAPTSDV